MDRVKSFKESILTPRTPRETNTLRALQIALMSLTGYATYRLSGRNLERVAFISLSITVVSEIVRLRLQRSDQPKTTSTPPPAPRKSRARTTTTQPASNTDEEEIITTVAISKEPGISCEGKTVSIDQQSINKITEKFPDEFVAGFLKNINQMEATIKDYYAGTVADILRCYLALAEGYSDENRFLATLQQDESLESGRMAMPSTFITSDVGIKMVEKNADTIIKRIYCARNVFQSDQIVEFYANLLKKIQLSSDLIEELLEIYIDNQIHSLSNELIKLMITDDQSLEKGIKKLKQEEAKISIPKLELSFIEDEKKVERFKKIPIDDLHSAKIDGDNMPIYCDEGSRSLKNFSQVLEYLDTKGLKELEISYSTGRQSNGKEPLKEVKIDNLQNVQSIKIHASGFSFDAIVPQDSGVFNLEETEKEAIFTRKE